MTKQSGNGRVRCSSTEQSKNRVQLGRLFGVVDGGRFSCAYHTEGDMQNWYYEGYTTNVDVTNLFVFNFLGDLIHESIN